MEAFADLFERFRPDLYTLCVKRLNDPSLAEDIVQEVFIRAFMNLPQSDHRKPIWPWLATIAIRMCIDLQRHRSLIHFSEDMDATVDGGANRGVMDDKAGSALDAVIASERRTELFQSLRVLSRRQRRVFLLYALDGWTCSEIAEAEGISLDAVHHLLFRVRRKMRATRENGPLALAPLPLAWLRTKLQESVDRARALLNGFGEALQSAGALAVSVGLLAALAIPGSDTTSVPRDEASSGFRAASFLSKEGDGTSPQLLERASKVPEPAYKNKDAPAPGTLFDPKSYLGHAQNWKQGATDPTPEETRIYSLTVSQNYEEDHTILASGQAVWGKMALFISQDGGGTWKSLPSLMLRGIVVLPAPGFPRDPRLFASAEEGLLQESDDGGETFVPMSISGNLAIPPSFGRGEDGSSKVWIGSGAVLEYDADTKITRPSPLPLPWGSYSSITFSTGYASDGLVLVSGYANNRRVHYRCQGSVCGEMTLPASDDLKFRLSPGFSRDGLAYAAGYPSGRLLATADGFRSFRDIEIDLERSAISDVAVWWNAPSYPILFVGTSKRVHRSYDGGTSWQSFPIDVPNPGAGVQNLVVTPTGRLLVSAQWGSGIACSDDLGLNWTRRCPPEPLTPLQPATSP